MGTRNHQSLEINIKQIGGRDRFLEHQGDENGSCLTVSVHHGNLSVKESLEDIGCGWSVELERRSTDKTVPYILKLQRKTSEGKRTAEFLQFNIQSTIEGDSYVTATGGRLQTCSSLVLRCDNLRVMHNFSSESCTAFETSRGMIRINSKVTCPVLSLSACEGKDNVVLMSEGNLVCNALKVTAKKLYVDGLVSSLVNVLTLEILGNLHLSTHGVIGRCHGKGVRGRLVVTILDITVSGDVQNYGRMVSSQLTKVKCKNYKSCLESKEETVQKGYSAIKTRDKKTAPDFRGFDEVATIKDLHNAVRSLNKQKVSELLENGADPRALFGKKEKFAKSAIDVAKSKLAKSQMACHTGHESADRDLKTIREILDMLNWWDSMRGDIVSQEGIEICCEENLEDCSQLKAPKLILKVKGDACVEEGSFWSCGVVSGFVEGKMQIDGTWKLKQFASLDIHSDLVTSLTGRVIVADGGRVITHQTFHNSETWYNRSGCLCIECDVMSQEDWATVRSLQDLELIVNGKTADQWFGEVEASHSLKITSKHNVQCHALVTSQKVIHIVLERDKQDHPTTLEVAGNFQVAAGPVIVQTHTPENCSRNQLIVSGKLQSNSLQASDVHTRFLSNSVTHLKPISDKRVLLHAGEIETHKQSVIDMANDNENQSVVVLCEDSWNHEGLMRAGNTHELAVHGEFTFSIMRNQGMIEGFNTLKMDVADTFENHVELKVPDRIEISGDGIFINHAEGILNCNNGRLTISELKKVHLKQQSCTFGNCVSVDVNGCLLNEGLLAATMNTDLAVDSLDNKNGVISSKGGDISITWLAREEEGILEGVVLAPNEFKLTTHSETTLTIGCTDTESGGSQFQIPFGGMTITSPLACVIVDSALFGSVGNEIVSLATGNGCIFHSKSDIPNLSLALGPKVREDEIFIRGDGDEGVPQLHQVVVVSNENDPRLALKGNICLENGGATVSSKVDLISDACLTLKGSYGVQMHNISFTTSSATWLPGIQPEEGGTGEKQANSEPPTLSLRAEKDINFMGLVSYSSSDDGRKNTYTVKCEATDVTIRNGLLKTPFLAMMVKNKLLLKDGGTVEVERIGAEVGTFKMEESCCLKVTGTEESGIYVKDEKAYLEGSLVTQGNGTMVLHSQEDIIFGNLKCEQANTSSQIESMKCITLENNCDIKVVKGVVVLKSTMEEGTITVNGKVSGKKTWEGGSDTEDGDSTDRLIIESFIIKLQDVTMDNMSDLSLSADNILEVTKGGHVLGCKNVVIEAKVFQLDGKISEVDNLDIHLWSSAVKGSVEDCGEVKITSELLLVNNGFIQGKKIGVIAPVFLNIPGESDNAKSITVPQIGNEKTELLVIEGLLSLWTKSIKHARNIDLKSMLHFEFSSETSTMPNSDNLDNWKKGMENILQPAAAPDADMQNLINEASKLQKVALQLSTASHLCQGVMGISKNIQENGVQQFQMKDLVDVMGKAHMQYTKINSFKALLSSDPLLKKLKKGTMSARRYLSKLFGKKSFSKTLKFQDVDPSGQGSIRETTWISKRAGDGGVHTDGFYMVQSQLWENRSSLEACGDIIISSSVLRHCGSQNRAMKACRIILHGDDINVRGMRSSETRVKGSRSVNVADSVSNQLHAEGKTVTLESAKVHGMAKVDAEGQANIKESDIEFLKAKGNDVNVSSTTVRDFADVKAVNDVNIANSSLEGLDAEGRKVHMKSTNVQEMANIKATDQANITSSDINVLKANANDVNVASTTVRNFAEVKASNQANIANSNIKNVQAEGRNVNMKSSTVQGMADVKASGQANIEGSDIKVLLAKGKGVRVTSTTAREYAEVEASDHAQIEGSDIKYLEASGDSVNVRSTRVRDYADIDAKKAASVEGSDINAMSAKGKNVSLKSTKVHETANVEASNKANISNVEAKNLDVTAENDVDIGDVKVKEVLKATSKEKDVRTTGNIKAKTAVLKADKGTVHFDKAKKYKFETLSLKQKTIASKDLRNLLDKSGAYSNLKVSDQLDLAVDDHVTLDASIKSFFGFFSYDQGINVDHGFSLEAKSVDINSHIHSNKNLKFTAKEGGINVGSGKVVTGDSVYMKAKNDIVHHSGSNVKAKKDVVEKSTDGSITTHAATVSAGRYLEFDAAKDINILAEGGHDSAAKKSYIQGGTGLEYDDNGEKRHLALKMKAGRNITVDASKVSSEGDNMITAKKDIVFKPRAHRYCSKREKKYGFLGLWSTTTEEWSTHVDRAEISSSGGRNIIVAEEGSVTSTATDIRAQENRIIAKGPVTLQDLVTKTERFSNTSDCFGGAFYRNQRHETHDVSHGTVVRDESAYANTVIMSKTSDINVTGSEIDSEGNVALIAEQGKVNIKERILDHHIEDHTSGIYVKAPDEKSGFGIGYHYTRTETDYQGIAGRGIKAKGSVLVKAKELISDVSYNVGGNLILDVEKTLFTTPELKSKKTVDSVYLQVEGGASGYRASLNYDHKDEASWTRAEAGLNVGGTLHVKGDSFRAEQGYDVEVGENLVLDVNTFAFTGAQERHASASHHAYIAAEGTEAEIGYDGELSQSLVNRNQNTKVGGKIIAHKVKEGLIDGANVDCDEIEGRIENFTVQSRQDYHETVGFGVSVGFDFATMTPTVGTSNSFEKSRAVNKAASLNVRSGGSENFSVGNMKITGAGVKFAGNVHNFAESIVSSDLHDISDSLNMSVKVGKPKPNKIKGSFGIGFGHKEVTNRATISSSGGKVDDNIKRRVNTDAGKARETKVDIGFSFDVDFSKKAGKKGKLCGGIGFKYGENELNLSGTTGGKNRKGGHGGFNFKSGDTELGLQGGKGKKGGYGGFNFKSGDTELGLEGGKGKKGGHGGFNFKSGDTELGLEAGKGKKGGHGCFNFKSGDTELGLEGGKGKKGGHGGFNFKSGDTELGLECGKGKKGGHAGFNFKSGDTKLGLEGGNGKKGEYAGFSFKSEDTELGLKGGKGMEGGRAGFNFKSGDTELGLKGGKGKKGGHAGFNFKSGDTELGLECGKENERSDAGFDFKSGDTELELEGGNGKKGRHAGFNFKSGDTELGFEGKQTEEVGHGGFNFKSGDTELELEGGKGKKGRHAGFNFKSGDTELGFEGEKTKESGHGGFNFKSGDTELGLEGGEGKKGGHADFNFKSGDTELGLECGKENEGGHAGFNFKSGDTELGFEGEKTKEGGHGGFNFKSGDTELGLGGCQSKERGHGGFSFKSGEAELGLEGCKSKEGGHAGFNFKSGDVKLGLDGVKSNEGGHGGVDFKSKDTELGFEGAESKEGRHWGFNLKSGDTELGLEASRSKEGGDVCCNFKSGDTELGLGGGKGHEGGHGGFNLKSGDIKLELEGGKTKVGGHEGHEVKLCVETVDAMVATGGEIQNDRDFKGNLAIETGETRVALGGEMGKTGDLKGHLIVETRDTMAAVAGEIGKGGDLKGNLAIGTRDTVIAVGGKMGINGDLKSNLAVGNGDTMVAVDGGICKDGDLKGNLAVETGDARVGVGVEMGKEGHLKSNLAVETGDISVVVGVEMGKMGISKETLLLGQDTQGML